MASAPPENYVFDYVFLNNKKRRLQGPAPSAARRVFALRGGCPRWNNQKRITVDQLISGLAIEPHTADRGAKAVEMRDGSLGFGRIGEVVLSQPNTITDSQARLRHVRSLLDAAPQCKKRAALKAQP
jgi:hypothetical protein